MLTKLLNNKKAEGYIDVIIGVFVVVMIIVITLNVFAFVTMKTRMDRIADTLIETATFAGGFGEIFDSKVSELQEKHFKFDVIVDADAWYNEEYKRVQLGDGMSITIVAHSTLSGINIVFPMDLTVYRSGVSERYWSPDIVKPGFQNPDDENTDNSQIRFALDNSMKKFHEIDCTQLQSIPTGQLSYTSMTYSECVMMGFTACTQCSPHMCTASEGTEFFNKQWHWGTCTCGEVAEIEEHFWVYQESDKTYYCADCLAAKRNDSVYCRNCAQKIISNTHANNCVGQMVQLSAPSVSLNGSKLTITPGDEHTTSYAIYVDGVKKSTVVATGSSTTFDLSTLGLVQAGTYPVTVKAEAEDYTTSAASSAVEYIVLAGATFSSDDGDVFLTWDELKLEENGTTYGYNASAISDTEIGSYAFSCCDKLTNITIPYGVTLGVGSFGECSALTSLEIPEGVTSIPACCFAYSALNSITLPSTLNTIESEAFGTSNLERITFNGTVAQWNAISKYSDGNSFYYWNAWCAEITVTCTDGTVTVPVNE